MGKPRQAAAAKKRSREPEAKPIVRVTPEVLDDVLLRLEQGESLSGICNSDPKRYPRPSAITNLCADDAEVNARYTRARNLGIDRLAERGLAVAGDDTRDPNSRRVELDAIKWFTSKMRPDKYGDASKLTLDGTGPGGSIVIAAAKLEALSDDELEQALVLQRKITGGA